MRLREALEAVYARNGALTPAILVEEARNPEDEVARYIHERLTWDDDEAAEKYRLVEAQKLIRRAMVTYKPSPRSSLREVRAFMPVPTATGRSYEPIGDIAADPLLAKLMLQQAEREWRDLRARYGHLREFVQLVQRDLEADAA